MTMPAVRWTAERLGMTEEDPGQYFWRVKRWLNGFAYTALTVTAPNRDEAMRLGAERLDRLQQGNP